MGFSTLFCCQIGLSLQLSIVCTFSYSVKDLEYVILHIGLTRRTLDTAQVARIDDLAVLSLISCILLALYLVSHIIDQQISLELRGFVREVVSYCQYDDTDVAWDT